MLSGYERNCKTISLCVVGDGQIAAKVYKSNTLGIALKQKL